MPTINSKINEVIKSVGGTPHGDAGSVADKVKELKGLLAGMSDIPEVSFKSGEIKCGEWGMVPGRTTIYTNICKFYGKGLILFYSPGSNGSTTNYFKGFLYDGNWKYELMFTSIFSSVCFSCDVDTTGDRPCLKASNGLIDTSDSQYAVDVKYFAIGEFEIETSKTKREIPN